MTSNLTVLKMGPHVEDVKPPHPPPQGGGVAGEPRQIIVPEVVEPPQEGDEVGAPLNGLPHQVALEALREAREEVSLEAEAAPPPNGRDREEVEEAEHDVPEADDNDVNELDFGGSPINMGLTGSTLELRSETAMKNVDDDFQGIDLAEYGTVQLNFNQLQKLPKPTWPKSAPTIPAQFFRDVNRRVGSILNNFSSYTFVFFTEL